MGITIGDPEGFTAQYNPNQTNAWNFTVGCSYLGEIRFGADYLGHFDPFHSYHVAMHAGFGGVLGELSGLIFYPSSSPFEIFFEFGPLIGFTPDTGTAFDAAIGMRFYP